MGTWEFGGVFSRTAIKDVQLPSNATQKSKYNATKIGDKQKPE